MDSKQILDHLYFNKLPQIYRDKDYSVDLSFKKYLSSLSEGGMSPVIVDIDGVLDLVDPEKCPVEFLPFLFKSFGLEYFEDIDPSYQRKLLLNIGELMKRRGTYSCVKLLSQVLTGLEAELSSGVTSKDLNVELQARTVEEVINVDSSVNVLKRYLSQYIPYYVGLNIEARISDQTLVLDSYRTSAIPSTFKNYDLT